MVAAHVWDTIGAQSAVFSGALITRPGNAPLPLDGPPQPTLVAADLRQLAQQLNSWAEPTLAILCRIVAHGTQNRGWIMWSIPANRRSITASGIKALTSLV